MEYLLTGSEMAGADRRTSEVIGIPSIVLMERAALRVAEEIINRFPGRRKITILAGPGNNGADGLAAGRLLIDRGFKVQFLLLTSKEPPENSSAMTQRRILEAYGAVPQVFSEESMRRFAPEIIVDALFGTGLGRPLTGAAEVIAKAVNRYRHSEDTRVVGLDLPSGISSEDGSILGCAIKCDMTVTFAYYKRGHFLYPGCSYCGETLLRQIGIHDRSFTCEGGELPEMYRLNREDAASLLTPRDPGGNKGTFGKILIIAGSFAMCGAALLCAEACMRSGAGMVKIFTREENRVIIQERLPEAMLTVYEALPESGGDRTAAADRIRKKLLADLKWADAAAIGPGIGRGEEASLILETLLEAAAKSSSSVSSPASGITASGITVSGGLRLRGLILDADALRLLASSTRADALLRERDRETICILTPHLAEFADLVHVPVKEAAAGRIPLMRKLAERYRCTVIGKDARTMIVSDGTRQICMITNGNSGMATAGSGDVLTGITAAMLFGAVLNGNGGHNAAQLAAFIHAESGDLCKTRKGEQAMLAGDLITALETVSQELRKEG